MAQKLPDVHPNATINIVDVPVPADLDQARHRANLVFTLIGRAARFAVGAGIGAAGMYVGQSIEPGAMHFYFPGILAPIAGGLISYFVPSILNNFRRPVRVTTATDPDSGMHVGVREIDNQSK